MYVPVVFGESSFIGPCPEDAPLKPEQLKWWDKATGLFYHPYLLLNAFEYVTKGERDVCVRDRLGIGKDTCVLGDSGGFQIFKFNVKVPTQDVLRWQELNCDRAFIVDDVSGADDTEEEFERKLLHTVENCKIFEANRTNSEMSIYRVLHGHTEERIRRWFDAIAPFPFEGWSIGFHPSGDVWGQARMAMFLYHMGWRGKLHFLGASGRNVVPVEIWSSKLFEDVVFDSTSYAMGVRSRTYDLPADLFPSGQSLSLGDRLQDWHELTHLPCVCPICSTLKTIDNIRRGDPGMYISLHNMFLTVETCHKLKALLPYEELYLKYVEENCKKDTRMAIEFMKMCVSVGYEPAVREYHRHMRLAVPTQDQSTFLTMMAPVSKVRLKDAVRVDPSVVEGGKKPRKKKEKGPVRTNKQIARTLLDLSDQSTNALEEERVKPECFGEFEESTCCDPGFCGEEALEECRRVSLEGRGNPR